jgi:antibiotic biosynthesis monooxygenase (ABM) superfamily enzyme
MTMVAENSPRKHLDVHGVEVSSVIVHQVEPGHADEFLAWQNGITEAAEQFPGYRDTAVYPPAADGRDWVIIVRFEDRRSLDSWLNSPVRAEWTAKLKKEDGTFRMTTLSEGFGGWFARELGESKINSPAAWKMALTVLLGLYPTVMLLTIFVSPYTNRFGLAISILLGNALSVSLLQWLVMPNLNRLLRPWLTAPRGKGLRLTLIGLLGVVAALMTLMLVFRCFTG